MTAGWRYVDNHGHRGRCDLLDDLSRGTDEATRRIHLDQYRLIVAALRFIDGASDVFLADGLNGVINDDLQHLRECRQAEKDDDDGAEN